ncbi:hypothetical protein A2625_06370 [candidate division WOR-1 bacterium RIFCSPHIGHO2_01_FULL_53_15]|uniref:Uncharacterized protein n=1 Tax=candidate division WOR-1 bacterium RIFCSPHIGHO2_01_FULL_53_15 TaxID=1802564 RepID=A0A1F4Q1B2_UNCSA|nr:MAG: hypothetical protein A2625_06370 [candidate division WOR-1 bacterium RIFCSPHIGHO2_01_FULL_53_15]OGC13792.1 MAG: hypothetical protein A3D23_01855 [candidate division WOR-1 bacterium RIFCSPHIGHO2_02_FULL_53_26]
MVRFAGYAKKRESKWPYAMISLAVVLFAILAISVIAALGQWLEYQISKPAPPTTTTISPSVTTSTLVEENATVYCYTSGGVIARRSFSTY